MPWKSFLLSSTSFILHWKCYLPFVLLLFHLSSNHWLQNLNYLWISLSPCLISSQVPVSDSPLSPLCPSVVPPYLLPQHVSVCHVASQTPVFPPFIHMTSCFSNMHFWPCCFMVSSSLFVPPCLKTTIPSLQHNPRSPGLYTTCSSPHWSRDI